MISLTEKAVVKLKEIAEAEGISHLSVRVRIIGGGCAGFSYDMCFDSTLSSMDESINVGDITLLVDPLSIQYLEGVEIDWVTQGFSEGFKFINPNVKSTCGCGSSIGF